MQIYRIVILLILIPILSSCVPVLLGGAGGYYVAKQDRSVGMMIDDASITAKINAALLNDSDMSVMDIDVDTENGIVTLYGTVKSDILEQKARRIAYSVKGVQKVISKLAVVR